MKLGDLLSVFKCKLCGTDIVTTNLHCTACKQYFIVVNQEGKLESEMMSYANYRFIFFPQHKQAHVIERDGGQNKVFNKVTMDELTPELATYWFGKLKKYVIFQ